VASRTRERIRRSWQLCQKQQGKGSSGEARHKKEGSLVEMMLVEEEVFWGGRKEVRQAGLVLKYIKHPAKRCGRGRRRTAAVLSGRLGY
jgi:hypothetical protein